MKPHPVPDLSRRRFLRLGLGMGLVVPASLALLARGGGAFAGTAGGSAALAQDLELTPMCDSDPQATPQQTEGPYFKRSSPERRSLLETGIGGTPLVLAGYVLSPACAPIAGALLDFWQADDAGAYDNSGFRMRGHQFTDDQGHYELETVVPGLYPGRTRHIHVKVQAPNGPILTTQLYFPDEPRNQNDGIFRPALVMTIDDAEAGKRGAFNFVVNG